MITNTTGIALIPSARSNARAIAALHALGAFLFDTGVVSRFALYEGGFPNTTPPRGRANFNNRTPCQSPGRGRPH